MSMNFIQISKSQYKSLKLEASRGSVFLAEIDGATIRNLSEYLSVIWEVFSIPDRKHVNYYAYLDWLRDLDWIEKKEFVLIIHNCDKMLHESPEERALILNSFGMIIIPWWQNEIKQYQVDGEPKPFHVYTVA